MMERYSSSALDRVLRAYKGDRLNQVCPADLRQAKEEFVTMTSADLIDHRLNAADFLELHMGITRLLEG